MLIRKKYFKINIIRERQASRDGFYLLQIAKDWKKIGDRDDKLPKSNPFLEYYILTFCLFKGVAFVI
jgi:hypothetical protein